MTAKPKLVFFGTGPVSLATLQGLGGVFDLEAIITRPDREVHGKLVEHPVKVWGRQHSIPVICADNKAELEQQVKLAQFSSRAGLVVDFGIIVSQPTIDAFPLGILNSHYSLLPQWRGPDPITPAILEGASETGVTIMLITAGMDEGPILVQQTYRMSGHETISELTDNLVKLSNQMLIATVPNYLAGSIKPKPQVGQPTFTHKLAKADGLIDWHKPAVQIEREVRAYLGWPSSYTNLLQTDVAITKAHTEPTNGPVGQVFVTANKDLAVYANPGALVIERLKPAGKREMTGREFLAGRKL
ncbi:MAG TPA: methionyl-tRNA formyltransferase [Candidatus Saccharimonadales bacterium]|nr:methionyl-tRNA formyltransferase [Candidatus Saccharimonadales bacterium]